MAATNINAPTGFKPITPNLTGGTYSIASGYATQINYGDPVRLSGTAGTSTSKYPGIIIGTTGNPVAGVFGGVSYVDAQGQPQQSLFWPANQVATDVKAIVYDDPREVFQIQMSAAFPVTNYYGKANFLSGTGINGVSGYTINSTGLGSGSDFLIQRAFNSDSNIIGSNYTIVEGIFVQNTNAYPYAI